MMLDLDFIRFRIIVERLFSSIGLRSTSGLINGVRLKYYHSNVDMVKLWLVN